MELLIIIYILLINTTGFILMKIDKKRAIKQQWRISEFHLWTIAFIGGALGAWMGMRTYRHKTKHPSFRFGLPLLTILYSACIIYII